VDRRFYKDRSGKQVIWTLKRLLRLIKKDSQIMKFKRIMLEKSGKQGAMPWKDYARTRPEGNWRPLSVPTLEWRVFNHMKYVLAGVWLEPTHAEWQHGARPRRGTGTALASLVTRVVKKPFIWEFDLTKFFDRVNWYQITLTLGFYQLPMNSLARWINNHVKKNPLGMEDSAYWEETDSKWTVADWKSHSIFSKDWVTGIKIRVAAELEWWFLNNVASPKLNNYLKGWRPWNWMKEPSLLFNQFWARYLAIKWGDKRIEVHADTESGIPQGDGLSPMLACKTFQRIYEKLGGKNNILMYMDDGLIFADSEQELHTEIARLRKAAETVGSPVNEAKSRIVRFDGVWKSDLKFLGYRWLGKEYNLQAASKKGATLILPKADIDKLFEKIESLNQGRVSPPKPSDLEHLSHPELAIKYQVWDFLLAHGWVDGKSMAQSLDRELKCRADSLMGKYKEESERLAYRLARANLYNASTLITRLLMRKWDRFMGKVGNSRQCDFAASRRAKTRYIRSKINQKK
jgi:hypothetical protein